MINAPVFRLPAVVALVAAIASLGASPASARESYVNDTAGMFKASTVSTLNSSIGELQRATGKEIVVVTVPSLSGKDPKTAVEDTFSQQQVNGVLFYFAKDEKKDYVLGDNASRSFFKPGAFQDIHNAMRGYLRAGDPDTAIITGVNLVEDTYRGHVATGSRTSYQQQQPQTSKGSFGMGLIWLGLILLAGFLIIRAIFRAMAGPRMMPPGYGGQGYGGPGYGGGGFGGGGGGGSFFSGLLGGLGGAFIGNELFGGGRRDDWGGGQNAGFDNNNGGGFSNDNSGFQSDAGQADMGGMGGGDWGGGGDSGGGGGDSGGGW